MGGGGRLREQETGWGDRVTDTGKTGDEAETTKEYIK